MPTARAVLNWLRGATDRTASKAATKTSEAAAKTLPGVDVSSFQGRPEVWKAQAGNISWAAVKITELEPSGLRYVNPDAADDWSWLDRNKKVRIGYLFGHPSVSVSDSVSFFLTEIGSLGLRDGDAIALDIEVTDGLDPSAVDAWCADVTSELHKKTGRRPLVYTFLDFAEAGNCAKLGDYPLWIADPSSQAGDPRVPAPWKTWTMHQYDISGGIDRDLAKFASQAAMSAALGKPKEPDMKNLGGDITSPLCSVRWDNGFTVVAGLGKSGVVQAIRWDGKWGAWKTINPGPATGAPAIIGWGEGHGHLYFTSANGEVTEIGTGDYGATWT
jgi:GH25 family lysozyme M1 (1,4-beta-N-acetylmuramidase)